MEVIMKEAKLRKRIKQQTSKRTGNHNQSSGHSPQVPLQCRRWRWKWAGGPCCNLFTAKVLLHCRVFISAPLFLSSAYESQSKRINSEINILFPSRGRISKKTLYCFPFQKAHS